jgi:hypothetical protein
MNINKYQYIVGLQTTDDSAVSNDPRSKVDVIAAHLGQAVTLDGGPEFFVCAMHYCGYLSS